MKGYFVGMFIMTRNELVQLALQKVEIPEILINVISKRVKQLGQGFVPLVPVNPKMTFMDVALKEVADGKLYFEYLDAPKGAKESKSKK